MSKKHTYLMFALLWLIAGLVSDAVAFVALAMFWTFINANRYVYEAWKEARE